VRRILIVDDDQNILDRYRESLLKYREIRPTFALGANAALQELRNLQMDVIVSDMHMPGIDGPTLLETVKEEYPDVVRMILCGPADHEAIFAALPVSHQVLAKPSDAETLCNVIERACRLRALLTDSLLKRMGHIEKLPSLPAVYSELMAVMARPDVSTQKISRIVERDAAMAAKILRLVNSACFGVSRTITRLDQAVSYLGMELIKNLALTVHVFASLEKTAMRSGFSFEAQQERSLLTARVARRLLSDPGKAQDAFTAGLLHEIGNLILAVCIPAKFNAVVEACRVTGRPQHEVEIEIIGVSHAEVGAYLLGLWGLPYPIVEAVAYHHNPGAAVEKVFDVPSAVSLAAALVDEAMGNPSSMPKAHLESLNVMEKLPRWTAIAQDEVQMMSAQAVV